jgi:hypothetical protein
LQDTQRTRIGNGSAVVHGVDQRLRFPRRVRELLADYLSDKPDATVAERSILKRACVLEERLERRETAFALKPDDAALTASDLNEIDLYARVAANHRRLVEAVGLERRAKIITGPTLGSILRNGIAQPDSEPPS